MQTVLKEITTVPGVIGVCLFHSEEGVTANNMPPMFTDDELTAIGRTLIKVHATCGQNVTDLQETTLSYEEAVFIVRAATKKVSLIVMFEPSMSQDLLTMSLNMAMSELTHLLTEQHNLSPAAAAPPLAAPDKNSRITAEELLAKGSGPLREKLVRMESCLVKVLGPMAKIVFVDSVYQWINNGQPSSATLSELADIIAAELGDTGKAQVYKAEVAPFLNGTA